MLSEDLKSKSPSLQGGPVFVTRFSRLQSALCPHHVPEVTLTFGRALLPLSSLPLPAPSRILPHMKRHSFTSPCFVLAEEDHKFRRRRPRTCKFRDGEVFTAALMDEVLKVGCLSESSPGMNFFSGLPTKLYIYANLEYGFSKIRYGFCLRRG